MYSLYFFLKTIQRRDPPCISHPRLSVQGPLVRESAARAARADGARQRAKRRHLVGGVLRATCAVGGAAGRGVAVWIIVVRMSLYSSSPGCWGILLLVAAVQIYWLDNTTEPLTGVGPTVGSTARQVLGTRLKNTVTILHDTIAALQTVAKPLAGKQNNSNF